MFQAIFKLIGASLLLGLGISWLTVGYSSWYMVIVLLAYVSFSISDGKIKKWTKVKQIPFRHMIFILFAFVLSVAIIFGFIQLSNYLINDIFHLTGMTKTIMIYIAIILSLYPMKFTLASIVYKVMEQSK